MGLPTAIVVTWGSRRHGTTKTLPWHHRRVNAAELWSLVGRLSPDAASTVGGPERLAEGLSQIRARWPAAPAVDHAFVTYFAERLGRQRDLATAITRLRLDDLFLAWWSGCGDPRGITAFESTYSDDLRRVVQRFRRLPADELHQLLRIKLFVGNGTTPPRIFAYSGFGFLQNWLRVTAARTLVDVARADQGRRYTEELDDAEFVRIVPPSGDPRDAQQRAELRIALKHAFAVAVANLSPRQRTFLRHVSVDRLTLDQVAALYRIHRATVARTLAAARERLLGDTRAGVVAALGIESDQMTSALGLLDSRLELSLSRVLRDPTA